jgi:hypothetical protein
MLGWRNILQDAYITFKTLSESKTTSLYGSIHTILEQISEIKNLDQFCIKLCSFKNKTNIHLKSKFIELWRDQMLQQRIGKLRTYITFKSNFDRENISVCSTTFEQRRCLTQLRISCHQLKIETVIYQGTLLQDSKCERCSSGEVEDEYYFLFHCNKLENDRNLLLKR